MLSKVNVNEKLKLFNDHWSPKLVGEVNDCAVKLVKLSGEFVWHHHDDEDELFYVVDGEMLMRLRDGDVKVSAGEFIVIPHGVEHQPVALTGEVSVLLVEPQTTLNTGNVREERTREHLERI